MPFDVVQAKKSKTERIEEKKAERRAKEAEKTKVVSIVNSVLIKCMFSGDKRNNTRRCLCRKITITGVTERVRSSSSKGIIWNDRL